ncbi:T9SS type A sorting domain-containing protein [Chryseobacterium sp.]|uniref:Ig-like domain-containing protein n=1 Tax=Chryseobacterium sp. TaxID=1871047 RepID=UPI00289867F5|nr:T9SS type A sorting domain-containing protein [Chryseobacterium sp.]
MKNFYLFIRNKKNDVLRIFCLLLLLATQKFLAQVSTYSFVQSAGTFTPISGTVLGSATGNTSATNLNSEVFPLTLPFGFNFNQTVYNAVNVSSNGFVTFGATAPSATNTTPISSAAAYEGAVSVWGRDISSFFDVSSKSGSISWETIGTAPNRELVIQWTNFRTNSATAVTSVYSFSFQIRLSETTNQIKMVYDAGSFLVGSTAVSSTAQIGLRGADNTDFNNRLNASTVEFINSAVGTANSSTQAFNTTNAVPGMPTSGLTYTFSPPTCWVPGSLVSSTTTSATANIGWAAPSVVPSSYDIYYSTTNTAPTSSTSPLQQSTTNAAILNSLSPSTVYYVWVRSNCGAGNVSSWSITPLTVATKCLPPSFISTAGAAVCANQTATLTATVPTGTIVTWYDSPTGSNVVGTGTSFTTPPIATTTPYYASVSNIGTASVGKTTATSTSGYTLDAGLLFDVYSPITINGVYVYPIGTGAGTVEIALQNGNVSPATTIQTITVNLVGSAAPYVKTYVPLNFSVPPGSNYKLMMLVRAGGVASLVRESGATWGSYPLEIPGVMAITGGNLTANNPTTSYYYFYDWEVATKCESDRTMVTASIDAGCLSTQEAEAKNKLKIYPNPFTDVIYINEAEKVKHLRISDVSGKILKTVSKPNAELRLGDLPNGMYLLLLELEDGSKQTIKVIKK